MVWFGWVRYLVLAKMNRIFVKEGQEIIPLLDRLKDKTFHCEAQRKMTEVRR